MSRENNRALRFYREVLGLDRLHYGLWNSDEALTLDNLKVAQLRYEDFVLRRLPAEAKSVLEVGIGSSVMAERMIQNGFVVEGLSPDETEKDNFKQKISAPFHDCRFEDFEPPGQYDCLVMCESCQYIPMTELMRNVTRCLSPGGHLVVFDYFVLDTADGLMAKSGHNYKTFKDLAQCNGLDLVEEYDVTDRVAPTLDLAEQIVSRLSLATDILTEKFRSNHPFITWCLFRLFRRKWDNLNAKRILINSQAFKANKKYVLFLYKLMS